MHEYVHNVRVCIFLIISLHTCTHTHTYAHAHTLQLERELQMISDVSDWCCDESFNSYRPKILALAREEATQSPKIKHLLTSHDAQLEAIDDGITLCIFFIM